LATDDIDALIALGPDCAVYTSQAETRPARSVTRDQPISAGRHECRWNVVRLAGGTGAGRQLVARATVTGLLRGAIRRCTSTESTRDSPATPLVYTALSLAARATAVTVQEVFDYGSYDDAEFTGVTFGFGTAPDHQPILFSPGVLASMWGAQVRSLAADLGIELDEVRERHDKWVTPDPIQCTMMNRRTRHGGRRPLRGRRRTRRGSDHHHGTRQPAHRCGAPNWPYPPDGHPGVHRVRVEGSPGIEINTHVGTSGIDTTRAASSPPRPAP